MGLQAGRSSVVWTVICALLLATVDAYHFAGGIFTWAPTGNDTEIKIDFRLSWTRSRHHCNDTTISSGDLIGEGILNCFEDSECPVAQSLLVHCTDFSATDDWSSGRNSFTYTPSTTQFSFGFSSIAWRTLVAGGDSWSLKTTADVSQRPDTNRINSSPTVEMSPVVALQHGCQHKIILPVYDADGDIIRCRFASELEECGGVCGVFPAELSETSCVLEYTANEATGWYAVAVQIEDFLSASSTTPLSSVPLQFLVKVFSSTGSCSNVPVFVPPTPSSDTCFPISVDEHFTFTVVAFNSAASIIGIDTIKSGPSTTSSQFSNSTGYYMRLDASWTPTDSNAGSQAMCFNAVDVNGQRSEQRCVHLYVEAEPNLVDVRKNESGSFIEWELIYDKKVERPDNSKYIFIYADNNDFVDDDNLDPYDILDVTSTNVTFSGTSIRFGVYVDLAKSYYILLEEGVVLGGCKQPAVAMTNKTRLVMERKACREGTYGPGCNSVCSVNCVNGTCDSIDGNCTDGCVPGYTGRACNDVCPNGFYGDGCLQKCGQCRGACEAENGTCPDGCLPCYHGSKCLYPYGHARRRFQQYRDSVKEERRKMSNTKLADYGISLYDHLYQDFCTVYHLLHYFPSYILPHLASDTLDDN